VVLAARQADKLKSLEAEVKARGGRAAAVQMDVTDTAGIARALDAAEAALGPITVLINNVGIAIEKLSTEQTETDWDAVINANQSPFSGAHSDIRHPEVLWAIICAAGLNH